MTQKRDQWLLRLDGGTLKGPLFTEEVLELITDGVLTGEEIISSYPGGGWVLLSTHPTFYEPIMKALEGAIQRDSRKVRKAVTEETIFMPAPPSADQPVPSRMPVVQQGPLVPTAPTPVVIPQKNESALKKLVPENLVLELKNLRTMERSQLIQTVRKPLIVLAAIIVVAVGLFIFSEGDTEYEKINLLAPGKPSAALNEAEIKARYAKALDDVEKDTFEGYMQAQNKLVAIVEGAPAYLEVRAMLCWVYKELWPFAKQDSADQKTISNFAQSTRVLDVTSPFGNMCEIIKLMTSGRYREARGTVENLLETFDVFTLRPVLYAIKAELLENEKDFQIAAPYYEKAAQDWDKWIKPKVRAGFVHLALRDYPKAHAWFAAVLAMNPNHKAALIGDAFAEYSGFRQHEKAQKLLNMALYSKSRVPRSLESDAWQAYGELLAEAGKRGDALNAAEKAYRLNPQNELARQLVLRLGGSDKLSKEKNQNNELIFMGDQYVRQGDCLSAQAEFKAAYELDNKNGTAALKAAKCLWQLNQTYEAIEWLNKAVKADNKLVGAYALQADYMAQRYDFNAAAGVLNNANRLVPNNHEILRAMAGLEFKKNNMVGAINYAQRALKSYDADIDAVILLSKANLALAISINSTLKKEQEKKDQALKDAIRYANKAVEFDATNVDAQIAYAQMLSATNGTDSAVEYLEALIKKYAYSFEYKMALADVLKEAERWNEVSRTYEQIVEADPRNKKAWIGLGEALRMTGYTDRALKSFLSAAVIDPTDGEALFQAGKLYLETSRYDEAYQHFMRVRSMNANFPRANYYAGRAAFYLGKFDEAIQLARDEKIVNPNLADSYLLTAEVYSAQNAFDQCASEYAQAIKLRPAGAEIYVKAAQCYRQAGSLEIANTMLTLAMERESGYPELYKETGALFEKRNENEEAIRSYLKYLDLAPNAPDKRDIEARIRRLGGR